MRLAVSKYETPPRLKAGFLCYESQKFYPGILVYVSGIHYNSDMFKSYWYVCTSCDASIEVVSKGIHFQDPSCNCSDPAVVWCQTSVVESSTNQTKGNEMQTDTYGATVTPLVPDTYNANLLVTYKDITDGTTTFPTIKVNDLEWKLDNYRRNSDELRKSRGLINGLSEQVSEWADPNYDKEEVLIALCEYFGINPCREVEFTATIDISGTISVPFNEVEDFDLDNHLSDTLAIDFNHGDSELSDWTINYAQVQ